MRLQKQLSILKETTGSTLRVDHTYKFVKSLGAYSVKADTWVIIPVLLLLKIQIQLSCSLLIILNEDGMVLAYDIVPNDKRELISKLFMDIWNTPNRQKVCLAVYSDNPKSDKNCILVSFAATHHSPALNAPDVLLDVFHGKSRVVKEMAHNHPDFRGAQSELAGIFAALPDKNAYPLSDDLVSAFQDWLDKYSTVCTPLYYEENDKLFYLGIYNGIFAGINTLADLYSKSKIQLTNLKLDSNSTNRAPIVTPNVRHQVELLQQDPDLDCLWRIRFHKEVQGTSYNESLHSTLRIIKPLKTTGTTYATLLMMVGIAIFRHNTRYFYQYFYHFIKITVCNLKAKQHLSMIKLLQYLKYHNFFHLQ